jgi:Sulfatase-modifying factor enzyme 1/KAP family P-loop domain
VRAIQNVPGHELDQQEKSMPDGKKLIRIIGDQHRKKTASPEFHFSEYASTLAEIAMNSRNETPLCVLVQGEWGVGKSTLMDTIQTTLRKEGSKGGSGKRVVKPIWFNAWKYKDAAPVMSGLLSALLKEVGHGGVKEQFRKQFLENRGRIAKAIIYAFPAMLDKFLTDGAIKEQFEKCSTNIDAILSKCGEIDVFQQAFLEVAAAWLMEKWGDTSEVEIDDEKYCLAVFIDDLDRCDEAQIRAVLEAIKLFLDFPGVCFYLAMDQHQLDQYLKGIFKDRSKDALDKFVQVIFNIPVPPQEDFQVYVKSLLSGHPLDEYLHEEGQEILVASLPANPRSAKRYLNDMAVWFSIFGKINKELDEETQLSLMPYTGRYHLLSHAVQKMDRPRWNAKAGSAEVLLAWLHSLREKAGQKSEKDGDIDFRLANSERLMSIVEWMLDPAHKPELNLELIMGFRQRLVEPSSPSVSGGRINPLTWIKIPGRDYEICAYPVTQNLYNETMSEDPSYFNDNGDHPVEQVSWFDAVRFCNKLSKKERMDEVYEIDEPNGKVKLIEGRKGIRLPTEEEWEHACHAGSNLDVYGPLEEIAWFDRDAEGSTHPVGLKKPNSWGLYDMLGNVWEWCWDLYKDQEESRVIRGGSYFNTSSAIRSSNRRRGGPSERDFTIGFRLARDVK